MQSSKACHKVEKLNEIEEENPSGENDEMLKILKDGI